MRCRAFNRFGARAGIEPRSLGQISDLSNYHRTDPRGDARMRRGKSKPLVSNKRSINIEED